MFFQTFINYAGPLRIETLFSWQPRQISNNPGYVRGKECDEESWLQLGREWEENNMRCKKNKEVLLVIFSVLSTSDILTLNKYYRSTLM